LHHANTYAPPPDYRVREKQFMEMIEREIAALPPKMRVVFEMSRKSDYSHREIAAHLDIAEETVKKQIKNALKILRNRLGLALFIFLLIKY
ncbi:MAG TPA: sigma-70 family RNA polymerase sigma factor, partial [Chitinophaga sp.]